MATLFLYLVCLSFPAASFISFQREKNTDLTLYLYHHLIPAMSQCILVVDDEHLSRSFLHDLILEQAPQSEVYEAESADEAIALLEKRPFDIVFSDIRMPHKNGFDMLQPLARRDFDLVFVTAYNQYAIKAIKEGAADYLLKPIKKAEFRETFAKILQRRAQRQAEQKTLAPEDYLRHKMALGHKEGIKYILLQDIVYLEARNTYTILVLADGEKITASKPLSKFEQTLSGDWFFRVHKSYILNIAHFREYISRGGDTALMSNGDKVCISRYRLAPFLSCVGALSGKIKI